MTGQTHSAIEAASAMFSPRGRRILLAVLLAGACLVRIRHLDAPPLYFHATRQFNSALTARDLYLRFTPEAPAWRKDISARNRQRKGVLEPPVMQLLAAGLWRLSGQEDLRIPRLAAILFWVAGGAVVYRIGRRVAGADGALAAAAFFLFLPFGVSASRSFQPEALMVLLMLTSVSAVLWYFDQPTWGRLAGLAAATAAAIFVKPMSAPMILGAYVGVGASTRGLRKIILSPQSWVLALLGVLPTLVYYFCGIVVIGFISGSANATRVFWSLLLQETFWLDWLEVVWDVVGSVPFMLALLGVILAERGPARALLAGLWAGYLAYGMIFNYAMPTHDYYQLPLIAIVGLSLGVVAGRLMSAAPRGAGVRACVGGFLLLAAGTASCYALSRLGGNPAEMKADVRIAREVGQVVSHSPRTIFLSPHYGAHVVYYGEISGRWWPNRPEFRLEELRNQPKVPAPERLKRYLREEPADFFIVMDFAEWEAQADLREHLQATYPAVVRRPEYIIFDLTRPFATAASGPASRAAPADKGQPAAGH